MTPHAPAFCVACAAVSLTPRSVSPITADTGPSQPGDLYICPCGSVSELTLQGWKEFTTDQINNLPVDEFNDLNFAIRTMQAQHRIDKAKLS